MCLLGHGGDLRSGCPCRKVAALPGAAVAEYALEGLVVAVVVAGADLRIAAELAVPDALLLACVRIALREVDVHRSVRHLGDSLERAASCARRIDTVPAAVADERPHVDLLLRL